MLERLRIRQISIAGGAVAIIALLSAALLLPRGWRERLEATAFDLVLAADHGLRPRVAHGGHPPVIVVDLDRRSLDAVGPWPWPRARMAALVEAIAAAKPAVAAIDILFADHGSRPSVAVSRRSAAPSARDDASGAPEERPDGNERLAATAGRLPLVLGFVLDPAGDGSLPKMPIAMRGSPPLNELWTAQGAQAPFPLLTQAAGGIGTLSLPADADGVVRQVPLLVGVGGYIMPGLALETVRLARQASVYLLEASPPILAAGDIRIPLASDGLLRLVPASGESRIARTISAIDIIERTPTSARLAGAVVLVGGSAPEIGGLRATAGDPLTPSVQIHANAIEQIFAGRFPRAAGGAIVARQLPVLLLSALALAASVLLAPVPGTFAVIVLVGLTWAAAIAVSLFADRLVDPLTPSLAAAAMFVVALVTSFAVTHRREILVRRRFEQHLAPAVVQRIVEQPGLVKLGGERREVTALFTDIEGFTAMTHRADPQQLVGVLDSYFEGIAAIVIEHGGMVDKLIGDAVHAIFNAPLDLDEHPRRAVECAIAIHSWTEQHRCLAAPAAIGLGRTRIGLETGQVIVGDVGLHAKLDYTAHGDAVNSAARFEGANKALGSAICVGPAAAARCDPAMLRPLGTISVRGRDEPAAVFEPWPPDCSPDWRERYLLAFRLIDTDPARAAEHFEKLASERQSDRVVERLAASLRATAAEGRSPEVRGKVHGP
jgi:adenylate cyclase